MEHSDALEVQLREVYEGARPMEDFLRSNDRFVCKLASQWPALLGNGVSVVDIQQDVRIVICAAMQTFDSTRGYTFYRYVRSCVRWYMLRRLRSVRRSRAREERYVAQQIVEERVVPGRLEVSEDTCEPAYVYVSTIPDPERAFAAVEVARRLVGMLPSEDARVVAAVLRGDDPVKELLRLDPRYTAPRKKVRRSIAAASERVRAYDAVDPTLTKETAHAAPEQNETVRLRPIRKVRQAHSDQRQQGACVG